MQSNCRTSSRKLLFFLSFSFFAEAAQAIRAPTFTIRRKNVYKEPQPADQAAKAAQQRLVLHRTARESLAATAFAASGPRDRLTGNAPCA
jgi:hypothetical protein